MKTVTGIPALVVTHIKQHRRQGRILLVLGSWILYAIIFVLFYPRVGPPLASLSMVSLVLMAWLFGTWAGFIGSVLNIPISVLLMVLFRLGDIGVILERGVMGFFVGVISSVAIGRLRDIHEQLKQEITERKKSEERIQQQMTMLRSLYAGARQLTQSLNAHELAEGVVRTCVDAFGVGWAWLYQNGPDGNMQLFAQHGSSEVQASDIEEIENALDSPGIANQAIRDGSPVMVMGESGDRGLSNQHEAIMMRQGLPCLAGFALISHNIPIGALTLLGHGPDDFTADRLEFFQAYANQVATALTNAYLYGEQQNMASTDGLTGLPNRRSFDEKLTRELSRAMWDQHPLALLMLDMDNFKKFNDTYGHPAGDQLLKTFASVLRNQIRGKDTAARYGGDEFAVILPGSNQQQGYAIADRIRLQAAEQMRDADVKVTVSIGVASAPIHAETPRDLIQAADTALYRAKQDAGNRVVVCGEDLKAE